MRLKSFHGSTLTDAMRSVREALGENAIIVATREEEGGGIRVTAAIDEVPARNDAVTTIKASKQDGSEALETIAEALTRHQVPSSLAEKLMATATQFANDDPLLSLGAAIDMHFKFQPIADLVPGGKNYEPLLLVGPPGAGKTLCTAKFATKAVMNKCKPSVISTDLERAGGMEQLAVFTRLLKIDLIEIEDWHALRDIVSMQKTNPVFIDTAGRNIFDAAEREKTREFIASTGSATLVLPAGLDATEATDMAHEFRNIGVTRLMITRLDTIKRIGSVMRLAYDARLPLSNYSISHKVTEAPQPLNPVVLARMILKKPGAKNEVEEQNTAPNYGVAQ